VFHGAGMRPMWDTARMERNRAGFDALTAAKIAADVVDHLVRVDVAVIVGHRHRFGMVVQLARAERADDEVRPLERLMNWRRLMDATRNRLEIVDAEGVRIEETIPADDIQW